MRNDSTVYVGLDVHKESIVAAYAVGSGVRYRTWATSVFCIEISIGSTMLKTNYFAVIVAAIATFVASALWYCILFGDTWMIAANGHATGRVRS